MMIPRVSVCVCVCVWGCVCVFVCVRTYILFLWCLFKKNGLFSKQTKNKTKQRARERERGRERESGWAEKERETQSFVLSDGICQRLKTEMEGWRDGEIEW